MSKLSARSGRFSLAALFDQTPPTQVWDVKPASPPVEVPRQRLRLVPAEREVAVLEQSDAVTLLDWLRAA
jgi:hypothetical protein